MPIMSRCAPSRQRPPPASTRPRRASFHTTSESMTTPSRSKITASGTCSHGSRQQLSRPRTLADPLVAQVPTLHARAGAQAAVEPDHLAVLVDGRLLLDRPAHLG